MAGMAAAPTLLVLVRHGQSTRNRAKNGHVNFPDDAARDMFRGQGDHEAALTEAGRSQAVATGVELRDQFGDFDVVFHSGYVRARDTAMAILEAWRRDRPHTGEAPRTALVREHFLLRERDSGYTTNMTTAESAAAFPWLQTYWAEAGPFIARPPGGESFADVAIRARLFLDELTAEFPAGRILVVTHAGTMRMFRYLIEGWSYDEVVRQCGVPILNCETSVYRGDAFTNLVNSESIHWPQM